ncbi:unnamed protein product [Microthlaspi erraticum]|uniref:MORF/ORRM1/DAG-like MORF domain-containing protein n=1 Tax=Microthlaspi erraticum TaxID=1685480 RepID=A0A6D2HDJ8_9BRAS|nr:unnamed protein product [Microthlaspi erraticum]
MATQSISRSILRRPAKSLSGIFTRCFSSSSPLAKSRSASSLLHRSRPLVAGFSSRFVPTGVFPARDLSTQATSSSVNDPNRNSSDDATVLDGCDFEHWLVVMEDPEDHLSRDEIIDSYIKTLAQVVGSEEEAIMKIYTVSHRLYYAFGALVSEDVSLKLKGEPFINGKAVPYDPKYHDEGLKMHTRPYEWSRHQKYSGPPPQPQPNMSPSYQGQLITTEHNIKGGGMQQEPCLPNGVLRCLSS